MAKDANYAQITQCFNDIEEKFHIQTIRLFARILELAADLNFLLMLQQIDPDKIQLQQKPDGDDYEGYGGGQSFYFKLFPSGRKKLLEVAGLSQEDLDYLLYSLDDEIKCSIFHFKNTGIYIEHMQKELQIELAQWEREKRIQQEEEKKFVFYYPTFLLLESQLSLAVRKKIFGS